MKTKKHYKVILKVENVGVMQWCVFGTVPEIFEQAETELSKQMEESAKAIFCHSDKAYDADEKTPPF